MCRQLVAEARAAGRINFRTGSAELDDESDTVMQAVAAALLRCPGVRDTADGRAENRRIDFVLQ